MSKTVRTKIKICVMAGCVLLFLQGCNVSVNAGNLDKATEEKTVQTSDLKGILKDKAKVGDSEIAFYVQEDFDADKTEEAFAIIGEITDFEESSDSPGIIEGDVWFVSDKECRKLTDSSAMGFYGKDRILTLGGTKHILFDEAYATGTLTYAWTVSDGKAVDSKISKIGTVIADPDEEDHFMIQDSSYDAAFDNEIGVETGHTWKYYYFFCDTKNGNKICEYGGTEIDSKKADKLCGMTFADKLLSPGDTMKDLFYTGNGLVVLNYEQTSGDFTNYYHYIYNCEKGCFIDDRGEETTDDEPLAGTYLKALCPDMAVYPDVP